MTTDESQMKMIKLIIEIPEHIKEELDKLDEGCHHVAGWNIATAIMNGMPLPEGHGDLISRSELKDVFIKASKDYNHEVVITLDCALAAIDAAMSMEYTFLPQYKADLQCAYDCGYAAGQITTKSQEDLIDRQEFKTHFCKVNCGSRQCVDHADRCVFIDELMQFNPGERK